MIKNLLDWIVTDKFSLKPKSNLPTTDVMDGTVDMLHGQLYTYDLATDRWLSVQRQTLFFGRVGTTADQYLSMATGVVSDGVGYRLPRNAVITGMSVQSSTSKNYIIHIRKNDNETDLVSMVVAGFGASLTVLDQVIYTPDFVQCYLEFTGTGFGVDNPIVMVELAWRG